MNFYLFNTKHPTSYSYICISYNMNFRGSSASFNKPALNKPALNKQTFKQTIDKPVFFQNMPSRGICKFGNNCIKDDCSYIHQDESENKKGKFIEPRSIPKPCSNGTDCEYRHSTCWYCHSKSEIEQALKMEAKKAMDIAKKAEIAAKRAIAKVNMQRNKPKTPSPNFVAQKSNYQNINALNKQIVDLKKVLIGLIAYRDNMLGNNEINNEHDDEVDNDNEVNNEVNEVNNEVNEVNNEVNNEVDNEHNQVNNEIDEVDEHDDEDDGIINNEIAADEAD